MYGGPYGLLLEPNTAGLAWDTPRPYEMACIPFKDRANRVHRYKVISLNAA